ncbi:hypothetical protein FsymDg_1374 [Candidatus Protofrankia datiscae]|uniref:Uncharacterized protein n=1 Tax=Candidatus Protofrankia datiscae TaxID=2716812 RepID=F8B3D4_9ACTN|nr:hypothetical protein FsymDg_1374 [Candidatus Protofrankia datiscae]
MVAAIAQQAVDAVEMACKVPGHDYAHGEAYRRTRPAGLMDRMNACSAAVFPSPES